MTPGDLVLPVFVSEVDSAPTPIASMPGVNRWPVDRVGEIARAADDAGVGGLLIFGIPARKDGNGSEAWSEEGIAQRGIRALRAVHYGGAVIADVCLCEYTDHGHCGVLDDGGTVRNDETISLLGRTAASLARAGADVVAPSAMMDGMVGAIRRDLDGEGFRDTAILSYSVKFASAFYGPFRDAAGGAPAFGDRRAHQMDPAADHDAMREHAEDVAEGADMLMVKPGLAYLDVVRRTRDRFPDHPLAAYNVSGEYTMVKAAAERG